MQLSKYLLGGRKKSKIEICEYNITKIYILYFKILHENVCYYCC